MLDIEMISREELLHKLEQIRSLQERVLHQTHDLLKPDKPAKPSILEQEWEFATCDSEPDGVVLDHNKRNEDFVAIYKWKREIAALPDLCRAAEAMRNEIVLLTAANGHLRVSSNFRVAIDLEAALLDEEWEAAKSICQKRGQVYDVLRRTVMGATIVCTCENEADADQIAALPDMARALVLADKELGQWPDMQGPMARSIKDAMKKAGVE